MSEAPDPTLTETKSPQQRLALAEQAQQSIDCARALLKKRNYKEAFHRFKEAVILAEGTRIFPHQAEIAQLARNYRPALSAIKQWRNQKEELILAQKADSQVISQWEMLNEALKDNDRILKVFRKLRTSNANPQIISSIYWKIWIRLVKQRQYEELRPFLDKLGWLTLLRVSEYHAHQLFQSSKFGAASPELIIAEGVQAYEAILALGHLEGAALVADKLLSVEESDSTYAALITHAKRAKAPEQAKALYLQACNRLGNRRVRKSTKALGPLLKSAKSNGKVSN